MILKFLPTIVLSLIGLSLHALLFSRSVIGDWSVHSTVVETLSQADSFAWVKFFICAGLWAMPSGPDLWMRKSLRSYLTSLTHSW